MKTIIIVLLSAFAITLQVNAQASQQMKNSTPEERAQKITDWMKTNLQLSDEQVTSVHAINLKYANENESLKDTGISRREKFKKHKDTQASKDEELKGAMTSEQFTTYQSKKKELQDKMRDEVRERKN
jgi:hypothetical protein